jgi:hypothetical protein
MIRGARASSCSVCRNRLTRTSMLRSKGSRSRPRMSSISCARVSNRGACASRIESSRNSAPPSAATSPSGFVSVRGARRLRSASQHRANASDQLARAERLRDVIVGADFEADDPVDLLAEGGEHDDRNVRARAQRSANLEAALMGEHEIEHDEVEPPALERAPRFLPIGNSRGAESVFFQVVAQQAADFTIVVDDEDVRRLAHGPRSCTVESLCRSGRWRHTLTRMTLRNHYRARPPRQL